MSIILGKHWFFATLYYNSAIQEVDYADFRTIYP